MKYMGSKARIAKEILPIILNGRHSGQWYVEPFCGGCNTIDKVDGLRIANDIHPYLIAMFQALVAGWEPPKRISSGMYKHIRQRKSEFPDCLVGYVGFNSYGGKWFGGYRRDNGGIRDYWDEHYRHMKKQTQSLDGVVFLNQSYFELNIPHNSIVYCDPPYAGTTKYSDEFDRDSFWDWCRGKAGDGHKVFISEYNAPDDAVLLWEKRVNNTLVKDTGAKQGIEKLFTFA